MPLKPIKIKQRLDRIKMDPKRALKAANNLIKGRWQKAEPYIMKDASAATDYATFVIKGAWKEAEPYIMKDANYAVLYAINVLHHRWLEGEPLIKKNSGAWKNYRNYFGINKD